MVTHESSAQPPQPPPKESFARRYKFLWPMLVAVNLTIGGPFIFLIFQLCNSLFILVPIFFQLLEAEMHVLKHPAQKACLVRFKKQLFVKSCVLSL